MVVVQVVHVVVAGGRNINISNSSSSSKNSNTNSSRLAVAFAVVVVSVVFAIFGVVDVCLAVEAIEGDDDTDYSYGPYCIEEYKCTLLYFKMHPRSH
jgi:hypothetical protein